MICRNCGSNVPDDMNDCPNCGYPKDTDFSDEKMKTDFYTPAMRLNTVLVRQKRTKRIVIGSALFVVLAGIVLLCLFWNYSPATVSAPEKVADYDSLRFSNLNNAGTAAEDTNGNVYYTGSNGYIHKLTPDGKDTVIYEHFASHLNCVEDRIYFITFENASNIVCSVRNDGSELKTLISKRNVSYIYVDGQNLYYIENNGKALPNRGAVYMYDLSSSQTKNIAVEDNSYILSVYAVNDKIYYYGYSKETYIGFFKYVTKDSLQNLVEVTDQQEHTAVNPYSLTISNNYAYYIDSTKNFSLYRISLDGGKAEKIGGSDCDTLFVYGDYIYYTTLQEHALYRINIEKSTVETVRGNGVQSVSCAGGNLYCRNSTTRNAFRIALDGSENQQLGD